MGLLDIFKKKKDVRKAGAEKKTEKKPERKPAPLSGTPAGKEAKKEKKAKEKPRFVSVKKTKPSAAPLKKTLKGEIKKESKKIKKAETETTQQKKGVSDRAYRILSAPHISEKATNLSEKNKYVFKIKPRANKIEIRKAIKDVYGVEAVAIKIINVHRKKRKLGRQIGWRKGYKKAIVKVKEGQKIELLSR
jgi:large subunit ribosomal protein L23